MSWEPRDSGMKPGRVGVLRPLGFALEAREGYHFVIFMTAQTLTCRTSAELQHASQATPQVFVCTMVSRGRKDVGLQSIVVPLIVSRSSLQPSSRRSRGRERSSANPRLDSNFTENFKKLCLNHFSFREDDAFGKRTSTTFRTPITSIKEGME